MGKARKILLEMTTAVNTFLKDKSFTYFEEVKADFHMFKSQRVFNLVSSKVFFLLSPLASLLKRKICLNAAHRWLSLRSSTSNSGSSAPSSDSSRLVLQKDDAIVIAKG